MFEGKAKGVIDVVIKEEMDDSSSSHLVEVLQQKLKCYSRWEVDFTHCEGNKVADHQLAKMALHCEEDLYWMKEGPEIIATQLNIDKMYIVSDTSSI